MNSQDQNMTHDEEIYLAAYTYSMFAAAWPNLPMSESVRQGYAKYTYLTDPEHD